MSYGFEVYDASGNLVIGDQSRLVRVVFVLDLAWSWSGTAYLPDFDDTRGIFVNSAYGLKVDAFSPGFRNQVADSHPASDAAVWTNHFMRPSLSWNNSTKILSVTSNPTSTSFDSYRSDYTIMGIHYK